MGEGSQPFIYGVRSGPSAPVETYPCPTLMDALTRALYDARAGRQPIGIKRGDSVLIRASTINTLYMTYLDVVMAGRTVELQSYLFRWTLREFPAEAKVVCYEVPD